MSESVRMPAVFFGHGNPMNALERNRYSEAWRVFGTSIPKPKAVLCVSAHWYISSTAVTAMSQPETIHDFYGFPPELYRVVYPALGEPELAASLRELLSPVDVSLDFGRWGLDHGTWSVLTHVFPLADVPTIQLSIDSSKPAAFHLDLGRRLMTLRDRGVLVVGSGNIVHNLSLVDYERKEPFDWAVRFDADVKRLLERMDVQGLVDYHSLGGSRLAVPTPDHFLPLLYVAGMRQVDDPLELLVEGIELGAVSMAAYRIG